MSRALRIREQIDAILQDEILIADMKVVSFSFVNQINFISMVFSFHQITILKFPKLFGRFVKTNPPWVSVFKVESNSSPLSDSLCFSCFTISRRTLNVFMFDRGYTFETYRMWNCHYGWCHLWCLLCGWLHCQILGYISNWKYGCNLLIWFLGCELLVHYGHSCLVPIQDTAGIQMLYIFVNIDVNLSHFLTVAELHLKELGTLALVSTIQFVASLQVNFHPFSFVLPQWICVSDYQKTVARNWDGGGHSPM